MNLFLLLIIWKNDIDFGIWIAFRSDELIFSDTDNAKISKELGLTKRNKVPRKMAEKITIQLKEFYKNDPVKYDFAICYIAINKLRF
ncbi:MAG: DUF2400 family protein [Ignavibacteriae bacterium]|nr:DUF2400 family protein [Ignavibacteriota bacterium]